MIDVKEMISKYSVAELIRTADDYFGEIDASAIVRKPFNELTESPEVTLTFLHTLKGLRQPRGAKILDFGAGSCWSSKLMLGFGYNVIASDVSARALAIGQADIARAGYSDRVEFLLFDGDKLDIPDASVDAIVCLSAFHHVPNPDAIVREFGRVLKPGGVTGLSEPGPNHSKSAQAQDEMRNFTVVENDVDIDVIWATAQKSGFSNLELAIFYPELHLQTLSGFYGFLQGERPHSYENNMRALMQERRLFFMEKGTAPLTSLQPQGLDATVKLSSQTFSAAPSSVISIKAEATNTGTALWRPSDWSAGPVRIGPSIVGKNGERVYCPRWMMPNKDRAGVLPGDCVTVEQTIVAPASAGDYDISFQCVSEGVAWFGQEARARLSVR